ncbi:MAG: DNA internalization-related competence protein ComEC/Rec2 [Burkholderiales bacterium]
MLFYPANSQRTAATPELTDAHGLAGQGLTPGLLGVVAGSAAQLQQSALWPGWVYAGVLLAGLLVWAGSAWVADRKATRQTAHNSERVRERNVARALVLAACTALAFGTCGWRAVLYLEQALPTALEGRDLRVTGVVAGLPQRSEAGLRFRLAVESAQLDSLAVQVPPRIDLSWYGRGVGVTSEVSDAAVTTPVADLQRAPANLQPGERWQMTLRLKAPHGNRNPYGNDQELWWWEQGVQATGYVRAGLHDEPPRRLEATWRYPVEQLRSRVRDAIFEHLAGTDGQRRWAGIIAALTLGDQASIERADWDVFRATGVAHLMSISGLHITLFAWVAGWAIGWLWRRSMRLCLLCPAQQVALAGGVLLALAYAVFSGWGVPAQRTVWMLATVALLRLSGQRWPWPQVWLLAMAVVVVVDPWALLQAGFWLSFVAVGVLFATDSAASSAAPQTARGRLLAFLREQWVVTLALTPLTLLLFGQVSLVGLVANALAIPWVTLAVTPLALLGVLFAPLWQLAAWALQALAWCLQGLAALPWAVWSVAAPPLWAGAAGVLGGVLLAMRLPMPVRALGVSLLLPALLWQPLRPSVGEFELLAADIGQGNALLLRTAKHTLVYDAGPRYSAESDAGHRVLVPLLRALGERVDTLVVSHRDADHIGGARAVLNMQPQAALLSSIEPQHELQLLRPATRCEAGQQWQWDGVTFTVLQPQAADYAVQSKPNALSCLLRVSNGRQAVLLAGDIEQAQEARLVADPAMAALLRADVLLVPHHGSKTSSSAAFLDAVQPQVALVQAGYRNRYGHPAQVVMQRYQARGIRVLASPHCGAMGWHSAVPQQVSCERQHTKRYWHHSVAGASAAGAAP